MDLILEFVAYDEVRDVFTAKHMGGARINVEFVSRDLSETPQEMIGGRYALTKYEVDTEGVVVFKNGINKLREH